MIKQYTDSELYNYVYLYTFVINNRSIMGHSPVYPNRLEMVYGD